MEPGRRRPPLHVAPPLAVAAKLDDPTGDVAGPVHCHAAGSFVRTGRVARPPPGSPRGGRMASGPDRGARAS